MKRKGFTLIELLAVIVILAIIALIAVPVIMNIISSARKSSFEDTAYGLINAGEMYYASALLNDGITGTKTFTFTEDGSIPEGLNVKGDMPKSGVLEVNKDGKTALAITNGDLCIIKGYNDTKPQVLEEFEACELPAKTLKDLARTNTFAASVDACATGGVCEPGTEFAIEVAPGDIKNFYVIKDDAETGILTLIMDGNIGETVAWSLSDNTTGPIAALNYLESKTSGWINIEAKNYTLTDDGGANRYTITRTNTRARLLTITETNVLIGANSWMYCNLRDGSEEVSEPPYGYWLSSAREDDTGGAWIVHGDGDVRSDVDVNDNNYYGVRPVIEILK
ncbi:MAG: DUF1566 domain-containing protein [Firmicutes bacterium]|nr:DUF1566 domain-containing protein [Bacillota bacterium]